MELVLSAVTSDLISRFISFVIKKCTSQERLEKKLEKLQQLLWRVHTVVEEAEGRYITNSMMLMQLRMLVEGMYHGYHVLDNFKYRAFEGVTPGDEVNSSYTLSFTTPVKRFRRSTDTVKGTSSNPDLERALQCLEALVANMTEFVVHLEGCQRMFRTPYDTYLYIGNFMFGRHVEKQQVINILLQNHLLGLPVLTIIGGCRVGKKTLVGHVCNDERIQSYYYSFLRLNGDSIWRMECEKFKGERILIIIEFVSDVDDKDWENFYSSATCMGKGSKVIIISRLKKLARFATVKPICLNSLRHEEYSYLFKVLVFGSTNPEDHPQLASIAKDIAIVLDGSLITANVFADVLRKNLNVQFWLRVLKRFRRVVEHNISIFGEHPKTLIEKDSPIDITGFVWSSASFRLMPPCVEVDDASKGELPKMTFGDIIEGSTALPREFEMVVRESRIPPYTKYFATYTEEEPQYTALPRRKCRR